MMCNILENSRIALKVAIAAIATPRQSALTQIVNDPKRVKHRFIRIGLCQICINGIIEACPFFAYHKPAFTTTMRIWLKSCTR